MERFQKNVLEESRKKFVEKFQKDILDEFQLKFLGESKKLFLEESQNELFRIPGKKIGGIPKESFFIHLEIPTIETVFEAPNVICVARSKAMWALMK